MNETLNFPFARTSGYRYKIMGNA